MSENPRKFDDYVGLARDLEKKGTSPEHVQSRLSAYNGTLHSTPPQNLTKLIFPSSGNQPGGILGDPNKYTAVWIQVLFALVNTDTFAEEQKRQNSLETENSDNEGESMSGKKGGGGSGGGGGRKQRKGKKRQQHDDGKGDGGNGEGKEEMSKLSNAISTKSRKFIICGEIVRKAPEFVQNGVNVEHFMLLARVLAHQGNTNAIACAPMEFVAVLRTYAYMQMALGRHMSPLLALRNAIAKLQPTPQYLTPLHAEHLRICLQTKNFEEALKVCGNDVYVVDAEKTALCSVDALRYYYFAGCVFVACKEFKNGADMFRRVSALPSKTISNVMLLAYKKYVLSSLLAFGKVEKLPQGANSSMIRVANMLAKPYVELQQAFQQRDVNAVHQLAATNTDVYMNDENMGLVRQICSAVVDNKIAVQANTYVTMSLENMSKSTNTPIKEDEVEHRLLGMIENNDVGALIDHRSNVVKFVDNTKFVPTRAVVDRLCANIEHTMRIHHELVELDTNIKCSQQYIQRKEGRAYGMAMPMHTGMSGMGDYDLDDLEPEFGGY